jgi:dolichyl-phosphate-mannose-protein mannosyltransferase
MKMRFWTQGSWSYRSMLLVAGCAFAVGLWARIYNLGSPPTRVFDETYFPTFAYNYLQGLPVFDLHPPLGKFVLAASIALLGDTPLAWRLMPALFGCALVVLGAVLGWYYTKERVGVLLLAAFIASETILVAYSRTGLLDGILLFFVLATLLTALRAERRGQVI